MRAENLFHNVDREIDFFEFVFESFVRIEVGRILDVGCGTGRHYIPLAKKGYEVFGVDLSQNMLSVLKTKLKDADLEPNFLRKDMREIDFSAEFDAMICMNSVFMYLLTDEDISQALAAFHRALRPGGVAIIDIMNFLSLLGRYKEDIVEHQTWYGLKIDRAIKHSVEDVPAIWNHREFGIIEDSSTKTTYSEHHRFRMLNYNEMTRFLMEAGFSEIKCFGNFDDREEVKSNSKRLIFAAVKR